MTIVLLIIFILSAGASALMIWQKTRHLKEDLKYQSAEISAVPLPHHIRVMLKDALKEGVHAILIGISKGFIMFGKWWRKVLAKEFPHVHEVLYGKPNPDHKTDSSFFLATIAEYKIKMKRLKDRMKKEEKIKQEIEIDSVS